MNTRVKRRSLVVSIVLALLLIVAGFFGLLPRENRRAYAEDTDNAPATVATDGRQYYFSDTALVGSDVFVDIFKLTFYVDNETSYADDGIVVGFASGFGTKCKIGFLSDRITTVSVLIDKSTEMEGIEYVGGYEYAKKTLYISVPSSSYECKLQATANADGYSVSSRIYTYFDALVYSVSVGDQYDYVAENLISQAWEILDGSNVSGKGSGFAFAATQAPLLNYSYQFALHIPYAYMELLRRAEDVDVNGTTYDKKKDYYTKYYLKICETTDAQAYGRRDASVDGTLYGVNIANLERSAGAQELPTEITQSGEGTISVVANINENDIDGNTTSKYFYAVLVKHTITEWYSGFLANTFNDEATTQVLALSTLEGVDARGAALSTLENASGLAEDYTTWLQTVAGITDPGAEVHCQITYSVLAQWSSGEYFAEQVTETFMIPVTSIFSKDAIISNMYNRLGYQYISDFNVVYNETAYQETPDGKYLQLDAEDRILMAADYYSDPQIWYSNGEPSSVTFMVKYKDFDYSNFAIRVKTVDKDDTSKYYTLKYRTSNVIDTGEEYIFTFDYAKLEHNLLVGLGWLADPTTRRIEVNGNDSITVEETADYITVTCPHSAVNALRWLDVVVLTDLDEDKEISVSYRYLRLAQSGKQIVEETVDSPREPMMYSLYILLNFNNFMQYYGDEVNAGVYIDELNNAPYCTPTGVNHVEVDAANGIYRLDVTYTYNALFALTTNLSDGVYYIPMNHTSGTYYGKDFVDEIPAGYRVKGITSNAPNYVLRITPAEGFEDDYTRTVVRYLGATESKVIVPIHVEYTDKWYVIVNYLSDYEDLRIREGKSEKPAFAERKQFNGEVRVADYADIRNLSQEDLLSIIGGKTLTVMGLANVDTISTTYDGVSAYTIDLTYTYAAVKVTDYDGNVTELKIPLTSYADWCEAVGQDWTILWLNMPERKYFQYANDVARDKLYGFFSVAVFDHRVSDLNYWFKEMDGDGYVSVYDSTEVQGSALYKGLNGIREKLKIAPLTTFTMGVSELINDDNKMVYSHFFYLDGTTNMSYLGENAPDYAGDTDGALGNQIQDGIDKVKDWVNDVTNSDTMNIIKIVVGVIAVAIAVVSVTALCRKIIAWSGKKPKEKEKKKGKSTSKKKAVSKGKTKSTGR